MRKIFLSLMALCWTVFAAAQQKGFVITGQVNMPDGVEAGLLVKGDETVSTHETGSAVVKDGRFTITGTVAHPAPATLTLNNMAIVGKNHWPTDSIKWAYLDMFISNDSIRLTPDLKIHGSKIQEDCNDMLASNINIDLGIEWNANVWKFIEKHPQSPVALYLGEGLLQRGYRLTNEQLDSLRTTITSTPSYPDGFNHFKKVLEEAKLTTVGSPLVDIELRDTLGNIRHLTDIVPKNRYVLVDFWASWCGICLAAMPKVAEMAEKYKDHFSVIGVSIDTKEDAWKKSMKKRPEPWQQYITSEKGYKQLTDVLHIGNGVPYYLVVTPEGKVLKSPGYVNDIENLISK